MKNGKFHFLKNASIRTRLLFTFCFTAIFMFVINIFLYQEINHSMEALDAVYSSNISLNDLSECVEEMQKDVFVYLNTKSSDSLENYYRMEQELRDMTSQLNSKNLDSSVKILEKNIKNMVDSFINLAETTLQAKRGRDVKAYKESYDALMKCYGYIQTSIYNLNAIQFKMNSGHYKVLIRALSSTEVMSSIIILLAGVLNILLLSFLVQSITKPLRELAGAANEVAEGQFDITLPNPDHMDEVGIVTSAFSKMITSIREYVDRFRESLEIEQRMKERELLMETHLKDAQLKYLQAQINPHFLFNSLNAGVQLAMLEDADQTGIFLERMADYFRYNVRKIEESATLEEEIEAVDNYVYILNVRFAGDIHFSKDIDTDVENVVLPSMIIQPLVENAVNHGIRNVEWEGHISLTVKNDGDDLIIAVKDNGMGMTEDRIREILECHVHGNKLETDSTGIGLDNVIHRLELYFDQKDLLEIESAGPGLGTEVRLRIPYHPYNKEGLE